MSAQQTFSNKMTPETRQSLLMNSSPSKNSQDQSQIFKAVNETPVAKNPRIYPIMDSQQVSPRNQIQENNIDNSHEILKADLPTIATQHRRHKGADDEQQSHGDEYIEGFQRKKKEGIKTFLQNGVTSVLRAPTETLKFIMGGGQRKNKQYIKQMKEKQQSTQAKLADENFKKNHFILYYIYFLGFYVQYVVMPILILFGTVLCLLSLFLWKAFEDGELESVDKEVLQYLELVIGASLLTEWLINIYISPDNIIVAIFDPENLIDATLVFSSYWRWSDRDWYKMFAIFNIFLVAQILRSMRILKLSFLVKVAVQNFKKFVLKIKQNDFNVYKGYIPQAQESLDFDEEGQLNRFIVDSLIKLLSGILIESTYYLTFDQISDYEGFNPFSPTDRLTYVRSIYYTIVTFSTIGYGDIYPIKPLTRMTGSVAFLVNITVMSNFLGKFIEFLFQLSPYDRDYDFTDHIVVVGNIKEEVLKDLLDEIVENDKVQNRLLYMNEFRAGIKIIIVRDEEPTDFLRSLSAFYTEQYSNEVSYLKEGIFTASRKWYHQANLKEARILFAFSWYDENGNSYENDKLISLAVTGVRDTFPDLRIMLVLNTTFKEQLQKDSLYNGIQSICPIQLNQYIMATSLENPGFGTVLQHLLTMKAKNISKELLLASKFDSFMLSYIADMQQEIYSITVPDYFIGMTYKEVASILYLYGLEFSMNEVMQGKFIQDHISDDRKITLLAVETAYNRVYSDEFYQNEQVVDKQQLSIFRGMEEDENPFISEKKGRKLTTESAPSSNFQFTREQGQVAVPKTQILINPQNYFLKQGDVLYIICDNYEVAMEAQEIKSRDCEKYVQYATNVLALQKLLDQKQSRFIDNRPRRIDILQDMFMNMRNNYDNFDHQQFSTWKRNKDEDAPQNDGIDLSKYEAGGFDESMFSDAFDFNEQEYPNGEFQGHYIIFGNLEGFANVIQVLRKYTNRPAILFTEGKIDPTTWEVLTEHHQNLLYIKGNFLSLDDLSRLQLHQAHQILIMSNLIPSDFPDSVGICLARILLDQYDRNSFMIQLDDEAKISFLNKNPRLKDIECPNFFYPSFAAGTVHFSSMTTAILARIVYSPNWLRFFEDLTSPKKSTSVSENKTLRCIKITSEASQTYKFFGQLQYALIESRPSMIAIGMVKHTFGSQFHEELLDTFLTDDFIQELIQMFQNLDLVDKGNSNSSFEMQREIQNQNQPLERQNQRSSVDMRSEVEAILQKILGDRFILTNPSFYTVLEENDEILLLGDIHINSEITTMHTKQGDKQDFESELEKLVKDIVYVTPPNNSSTQGTKMFKSTNDHSVKNLLKLKSIKSMKQGQTRAQIKRELISELKRKYQGQSNFYSRFYEHLN